MSRDQIINAGGTKEHEHHIIIRKTKQKLKVKRSNSKGVLHSRFMWRLFSFTFKVGGIIEVLFTITEVKSAVDVEIIQFNCFKYEVHTTLYHV